MKIKDGNFINIQSFMVTELNLKGNDLLIYAIIYGFSQDGDSVFNGSIQYLSDWTNSSKRGVMKNLENLIEKGLIEKIGEKNQINCYKANRYQQPVNKVHQLTEFTSEQSSGGDEQSSPVPVNKVQGVVNKVHPIIYNNIYNNIYNKKTNFDFLKTKIENLEVSENLKNALTDFLNHRKEIKKEWTERSLNTLLKQLGKKFIDEEHLIQSIEKSIICCYQGVFPTTDYKPSENKEIDLEQAKINFKEVWGDRLDEIRFNIENGFFDGNHKVWGQELLDKENEK